MRIKKYHLILLISCLSFSMFVNAQSVEEIISKHIEAHGGAEKWDAINSMEITAKFTAFSEEKDFYAIKTKEGCYYSDLHIGQHKVKEAFNGKWGWTIDPWHGFLFPRRLNKFEDNVFLQKAEFFTPFYNYEDKGSKVEYIGEENVDGIDTYAIKLTRSNGKLETWYLNKETYLEVKSVSEWIDFGMRTPAESFFDDFREVNGVVIPFFVERMFGQRDRMLVIDKIEFNPTIDKKKFEMPRSDDMQKLAFLTGTWDAKVEKMSRQNSLYTVDNTVVESEFKSTNLLEQHIAVDDYYVQSMIMRYSYHADRKIYRVVIFSEFTSNADFYEGKFEDGVFIADNKKDVVPDSNGPYLQLKIYDIKEGSYTMEINNSRDKGANWNLAYKLSFTKK